MVQKLPFFKIKLRLAGILISSNYVIVPKTPTKDMVRAACKSMSPSKRPTKNWVSNKRKHIIRYQAMINAASEKKGGDAH